MYALQWSAILTELTVSKFAVSPQLFANNRHNKFYENPTNGLVADTKWQTTKLLLRHHELSVKGKRGKIVPVHLAGRRRSAPHILSLGTRWRWVVNFKHQTVYPCARMPVPTP
jgi:hypothetical protein